MGQSYNDIPQKTNKYVVLDDSKTRVDHYTINTTNNMFNLEQYVTAGSF